MTLGEKIQLLRKQAEWSQTELAERLDVSRQSVSKWESDGAMPDTDKIILLSKLFHVSTDYLLTDDETPPDDALPDAPPAEAAKEERRGRRYAVWALSIFSALCVIFAVVITAAHNKEIKKQPVDGAKQPAEDVRQTTEDAAPAWTQAQPDAPYILVHGLGGWGDGNGVNNISKYWGGDTGDLAAYLRTEGYTVYTPSVGPLSSTWDRACELYAQLTGTTVDYGAAHSAAHQHARFGRTYTTPLVENWGKRVGLTGHVQVNLIGHSFGGEAVRLLTSLLAFGDAEEKASGVADLSPLFTGGKEDWVKSVTTLCSPHNGSSLTCVLDSAGGLIGFRNTTELLASLCFTFAGIANPANGTYDFMLDQFGVTEVNGGVTEISNALSAVARSNNDHAGYELSPDGAAALNQKIRLVDGVYYFSYSYCTTKKSDLFYTQTPKSSTLPALAPLALAMGAYNGKTAGGMTIDAAWQENDGLVSVISARYPFGDSYTDLTADASPQKGVWNVAPTREGDHGTVIGLGAGTAETHQFYDTLFAMIESLT